MGGPGRKGGAPRAGPLGGWVSHPVEGAVAAVPARLRGRVAAVIERAHAETAQRRLVNFGYSCPHAAALVSSETTSGRGQGHPSAGGRRDGLLAGEALNASTVSSERRIYPLLHALKQPT